MTPSTLLLRQVHPVFVQTGRVTSQAFRPTPKDDFFLSVDNGDRITAQASLERFIEDPTCQSIGVMAISCAECASQELPVIEDGKPHPEHCSIDFSAYGTNVIEKKSKKLRAQADERGWLFQV